MSVEEMLPGESLVHYNARTRPGYAPYCMGSGCMRTVVISQYHWRCPTCGKEYRSEYDATNKKMVY